MQVRECHLSPSSDSSFPSQASIIFEQADAAIIACEQLNGHAISGRNIRCSLNIADLVGSL